MVFALIASLMYGEWFALSADNAPITNLHVKVNIIVLQWIFHLVV